MLIMFTIFWETVISTVIQNMFFPAYKQRIFLTKFSSMPDAFLAQNNDSIFLSYL